MQQDGLEHCDIIQKLEAFRSSFGEGAPPKEPGLRGYLRYRLAIEDPEYLKGGDRHFDKALAEAISYVRRKLHASTADKPYPPAEWLQERIEILQAESSYGFSGHPKWEELKVRMLAGDELWRFTSPTDTWRNLGGREGLCVMRRGRPVAHIITAMN